MNRTSFIEVLILLAGLSGLASSAASAPTLRVDTPGAAFRVLVGKAKADDVPDGRRIKGAAFAEVTVAGVLTLPPAETAQRRATRLVLHFRTSKGGPTLRKIILPDGNSVSVNLSGHQMADSKLNTLDFGDIPIKLFDQSVLKLVLQYPGGIDSAIDPGEFVLKSVSLDCLWKPGVLEGRAAREVRPLALDRHRARIGAARAAATSTAAFDKPRIDIGAGLTKRLDLCKVWASECGQPAADAFCALHGFKRAVRYTQDLDIGDTAIISSHQVCSDPGCDGFARIECE